jgi:hypothetical protein
LKEGHETGWLSDGSIVVRSGGSVGQNLEEWSRRLGVDVKAIPEYPKLRIRKLKAVRLGLYKPWLSNMDEGWTRWLLEQYEFPYSTIRNADIRNGKLHERFDAILIADMSKELLLRGSTSAVTRPEYRGGLGPEGLAGLKQFVRDGGTLITLGAASLLPAEEFPLPLKNALKNLTPTQFSCPGSLLKVFVDPRIPEGYGMPEEATAVFYNNIAFDPAPAMGDAEVRVIARYPGSNILKSGWIGGEEHLHDRIAAAEVTLGKGRAILLGFSVQNRAQPHGTFKLLFNAIQMAGSEEPASN